MGRVEVTIPGLLLELDEGTVLARNVRYTPAAAFDEATGDELERIRRGLRALAYSAAEGARHVDRVVDARAARPTCDPDTGMVDRPATPEEVDAGHELGIAFDPCPGCSRCRP